MLKETTARVQKFESQGAITSSGIRGAARLRPPIYMFIFSLDIGDYAENEISARGTFKDVLYKSR